MPGGADGKRVSRRRAFPKASKRDGPDRAPACRTPQDKTGRLCTRAVRAAGISCGSPRHCGLRFACVPSLCQCTAVLPVCCRFTCVPPLYLCAAALPVCRRFACVPLLCLCAYCCLTRMPPLFIRATALPACRRHILPLGNNGPLLLLFQKTLMRHRGNSAVSRSGKEKHGQSKNFFSFLKKRLAFSKIIGYNNQALGRDAKKQNMDD